MFKSILTRYFPDRFRQRGRGQAAALHRDLSATGALSGKTVGRMKYDAKNQCQEKNSKKIVFFQKKNLTFGKNVVK